MRKEWLARIVLVVLVLAAVTLPLGAWWVRNRGVILHARMAETGGWTPENLTVEAGQPLHLRLTSDDVLHGFAVGQSDQPPVDIYPGEVTEVTLTFDKPGKYTFYCTRWCSANHWRMRGTIEVTGPETANEPVQPPLYVTLNIDIDAPHKTDIVPELTPSARRGENLQAAIPDEFQDQAYYRSHSPVELWQALREKASLASLSDQDLWDMVALVWRSNTTPQDLGVGQQLYTANCAACHGVEGDGNGVFADGLDPSEAGDHAAMQPGEMTQRPTDFTDPRLMLAASPALLQGKIVRGGMGTGMPYWGPIFTDEQTWALVDYLWTFQFDLENEP